MTRALLISLTLAACAPDNAPAPQRAAAGGASASMQYRLASDYAGGGCYHAVERPAGTPLQDIVDDVGPTGVLTVDQACTLDTDLLLPERFTLRGPSWAGPGLIEITAGGGISFDGGGDTEAHSTVENLEIQGAGGDTAFVIRGRHQIHLRDLIVREFTTAVVGDTAFSIDIDNCNFNQNETSILIGREANTWRIRGGICSGSQTCIDIHPDGNGNDTMVTGMRLESNRVAIQVGGLSTYIAFNRFEGNDEDIAQLPTASGTAMIANNMAPGTVSDLSELNPGGLTGLPFIDRELRFGFVEGSYASAQIHSDFIDPDNLIRTQLLSNQSTDDGELIEEGYADSYAGWQLEMDGSTQDLTSEVRVSYRSPGAAGEPSEVFRIGSDGVVEATAFFATSDARKKTDLTPLDSALEGIQQLRGLSYDLATGAADHASMGLLADEVQRVFPSAVTTRRDGFQAVNYDQLTAPIVESIKELAERNAALSTQNADLEARLQRLEARLATPEGG